KLNLKIAETKIAVDVLTGREVSNQHRLTMNKAVASCAFFWRCLRDHCVVAGAGDLQTGGHDQSNVGGGAISRIVVKGKPTRRIHQVRAFGSNISEPLGCQWSTFGRNQGAAPAESQRQRLIGRHYLSEVHSHTWPKRTYANCILDEGLR